MSSSWWIWWWTNPRQGTEFINSTGHTVHNCTLTTIPNYATGGMTRRTLYSTWQLTLLQIHNYQTMKCKSTAFPGTITNDKKYRENTEHSLFGWLEFTSNPFHISAWKRDREWWYFVKNIITVKLGYKKHIIIEIVLDSSNIAWLIIY